MGLAFEWLTEKFTNGMEMLYNLRSSVLKICRKQRNVRMVSVDEETRPIRN